MYHSLPLTYYLHTVLCVNGIRDICHLSTQSDTTPLLTMTSCSIIIYLDAKPDNQTNNAVWPLCLICIHKHACGYLNRIAIKVI